MVDQMRIDLSIVIPTIGRKNELTSLLKSIANMELKISYEILIIDQNNCGYIDAQVEEFSAFLNLKHYNVDFRGLSKAKNFGITVASGEWICFPDDDCEFFSDTVCKALNYGDLKKADVVFGKCVDRQGSDSVMNFKKKSQQLYINNMDGGFVEATVFVKKSVVNEFHFDEAMGAGCFHGAEEGYDWLYRILRSCKYKVIFNPEVLFYHPQIFLSKGDAPSIRRVFMYRCGFAKLCFKNKLYYKYFKRLSLVFISLPFFLLKDSRKFRYYTAELLGLIVGVVVR
jgi:glycosyltransferase involved in cell wall biosynthesis